MQLENLHPLYYGYCLHWYAGEPATEVLRSHEFGESKTFRASPYIASLASGGAFRVKLEIGIHPDLPLLIELQARGATDFLADILHTGAELPPGVSWATQRPGGFEATDIEVLLTLTPYLALVFGALAEQRKTRAVLSTYLGEGPGREVFEGQIRRGNVRRIEAVVLLTDLRDFTRKTATLSDHELLDALNLYFECVADSVTGERGEVLKFVGDGMLSVFPLISADDGPSRCWAALRAVSAARKDLASVNDLRERAGCERLDFVAALDLGSVSYGNIGGRDRLDFTVVGQTVNIATRIEALAKQLSERTLLTHRVASCLGDLSLRSVGLHLLRGVDVPIAVFAPE
jgi:adenylate cyclase